MQPVCLTYVIRRISISQKTLYINFVKSFLWQQCLFGVEQHEGSPEERAGVGGAQVGNGLAESLVLGAAAEPQAIEVLHEERRGAVVDVP